MLLFTPHLSSENAGGLKKSIFNARLPVPAQVDTQTPPWKVVKRKLACAGPDPRPKTNIHWGVCLLWTRTPFHKVYGGLLATDKIAEFPPTPAGAVIYSGLKMVSMCG